MAFVNVVGVSSPLVRADAGVCRLFGDLFKWRKSEAVGVKKDMEVGKEERRGVLVVGAGGRLGSRVVAELGGRKEGAVYGLVREERDLGEGVEVVVGTLGEESGRRCMTELKGKVGAVVWAAQPSKGSPSAVIDNAAVAEAVQTFGDDLRRKNDEYDIIDFTKPRAVQLFKRLDDVIMGGVSDSALSFVDVKGDPFTVFQGTLRLENNGGFCGTRADFAQPINVEKADGIAIRVRGDGKRYKLNLKNDEGPEYVFQAEFDTSERAKDDNEWEIIRIPFSKFVPKVRGNIQYGEGAQLYEKEVDRSNITSIGLLHSKVNGGTSFAPGPFKLDLKTITAYRAVTPRFVFLSSAAVTRPTWDEEKRKKYASSYDIPIVQLNPGNILTEKLNGENVLRSSGIPYSIIRYTALNQDHPHGARVVSQGDTATGRINLDDAAKVALDALGNKDASFKTFEIRTSESASPQTSDEIFRGLRFDTKRQ